MLTAGAGRFPTFAEGISQELNGHPPVASGRSMLVVDASRT